MGPVVCPLLAAEMMPVLKSGSKLARRNFGVCKLAEERCSSVCEWIVPKSDATKRPLGDSGSGERAGVGPDTDANVTAEAAIPATSEANPSLRKHPLMRLDSRGRLKWTCSTLMHILLDQGDPSHLLSGKSSRLLQDRSPSTERIFATAGPGKGATMTAWRSNASIPRISFRVISLQQSGPKNPGVQSRCNVFSEDMNVP